MPIEMHAGPRAPIRGAHRRTSDLPGYDRLLLDACRIFSESFDYHETLRRIAELAVRSFADLCMVDLIVEGGGPRRAAAAHRDPSLAEAARRLASYPLDPGRPHLVFEVLRTGKPKVEPDVSDEYLQSIASNDEHLALLRGMCVRSHMIVPLMATDHCVGTITFVATQAEKPYTEVDLGIAEELAGRAGGAIEHAWLYGRATQAVEARDRTLSVVSHDLGNGLGTIAMAAEMVRADLPAGQLRYAEIILQTVDRMQALIQDLLDARRLDVGALQLSFAPARMDALIQEARDTFQPMAAMKSVRFDVELPDSLPDIRVDERRIAQVLSNLVGNAVKFTPPGGRVLLAVTAGDGFLRVDVSDTGPGMDDEQARQAFEPFWKGPHLGERGAGVGLGLSIVRDLVHAHRGTVSVRTAPGAGATFSVTLPLASDS